MTRITKFLFWVSFVSVYEMNIVRKELKKIPVEDLKMILYLTDVTDIPSLEKEMFISFYKIVRGILSIVLSIFIGYSVFFTNVIQQTILTTELYVLAVYTLIFILYISFIGLVCRMIYRDVINHRKKNMIAILLPKMIEEIIKEKEMTT
ncbi:hypothetical protein KG091_00675 [Carnobacteriaceae bacterium zg-ZUI78]|nr:hypothetical protein [Carnobacteriaceae bacterium zg-ZUI78]